MCMYVYVYMNRQEYCIGSDPCLSNPCSNGGSCASLNTANYTCQCPTSYCGGNCQIGLYIVQLLKKINYMQKLKCFTFDK